MSKIQKQEYIETFFLDSIVDTLESQKLQNLNLYKGNTDSSHQSIIICTSTSSTQMNGVVKKLNELIFDKSNLILEGRNSSWMLIEVKDILIHIFTKESRRFLYA